MAVNLTAIEKNPFCVDLPTNDLNRTRHPWRSTGHQIRGNAGDGLIRKIAGHRDERTSNLTAAGRAAVTSVTNTFISPAEAHD